MMERTQGSMRLLIERSNAYGVASQGSIVQVKDRKLPDILFGEKGQANHFDLVDSIARLVGGTATIFAKSGDDFVRVSTNVKRDNERAIGTVLDPKGKAVIAIRDGRSFYGQVDILGNPFLTGYEPIRNAEGNVIGIWYVGYKADMAVLKEIVEKSRFLHSGFIAIVDDTGKLRARSGHVSDEQVEAFVNDNVGWVVSKQNFSNWGFSVISAYPRAEVEQISRDRTLAIVGVGLMMCLVLIALLTAMLRWMVLRPLGGEPKAAMDAATRIAAGDLTTPIVVANGGHQNLMAAMSQMQHGLRVIVCGIYDCVTALEVASDNLVAVSDRILAGVSHQNEATSAIAATLEQVTVSIRAVTESADTANLMAKSAGDLASGGNSMIVEAVDEMRRSADSVNLSAATVDRLSEESEQIGVIVNVIKEIADQTNLLALNAAIEAARAGEVGKGFAVVADEVGKLAERTSTSTREISQMIGDIQKSTVEAVGGIEYGAERVNSSVQKAGDAVGTIERISGAAQRVTVAVDEISLSLKEQAVASDLIAKNVEQVASMNEENTAFMREMVADAIRLKDLAAKLKLAVGGFRV